MDNRLLGLAKKAGLLEIGGESVGHAARLGKARVILSAGAPPTTQNGGRRLCRPVRPDTPCAAVDKEELGAVVEEAHPG
jgi:hypothetical protein